MRMLCRVPTLRVQWLVGLTRAQVQRLLLFPVAISIAFLYFPYCEHGPRLCLFYLVTGHSCPACGTARALSYLSHGLIRDAIHFNPLVIPVCGILMGISAKALWDQIGLSRRVRLLTS